MSDVEQTDSGESHAATAGDPRMLLADFANESDDWVRYLVADVLANGVSAPEAMIADAYDLFRQEKALEERVLPTVPQIATAATETEKTAPLSIVRLSDVHGVNALVTGVPPTRLTVSASCLKAGKVAR